MKKLPILFLTMLLCMSGFAQATIDPLLSEEMARRSDEDQITVIVIMKSQYDRTQLNRRANYFATRAERREFVVNELKDFAANTQYDLRHSLIEMKRNGMVTEPTVLWMSNAMYFDAKKAAIQDLARRNDIEIIGFAMEHNWIPDGEEPQPAFATREITQNVLQVGANQVWELGYTGEGVVVAVIDTGVNYNHVDLADHLWDGGTEFPHHGYDVKNHDNDPMDDHGHGSHCSGTVCGDGTAGSQTGMAPNATLMCVKSIGFDGNGGAQNISEGIQWAVEHGCDMFSMSLGLANSSITDRTLLRHTCDAALDAGIVAAIAAGNEGDNTWEYPIPNNVRVPGSCPPPYMDAVQSENPGDLSCSVCVGAVDYNDNAAYFTSHGPVTWQNTEFGDYPYNPGIGLIRPDVCAPGVDIKSLNYQSNTGYTTMSGTSMATPCVAGCMALMLSKDIDLSPVEVCRILEETAVPLAEGKSNTYGFGRVDVLAAVEAIQLGAIKFIAHEINDPEGNNNHRLNPGESAMMHLTLENRTDVPVNNISVRLTTQDEHVNIIDDEVQFPDFAANETLTVENAFAFSIDNEVVARQRIKFSCEIYMDGEMTARFNDNIIVYDYDLQYGATAVINDDNANIQLNPGETVDLRIFVDNAGNELAQMVVGTLSTDYEFVTLNETEKPYSTIGADLMAYADFNVTLDAAAPEDFAIPFTLDLVDAEGRHTVLNFNYKNSCNVIFSLHDSFGDGWQGNYLQVSYSDGTPSEQMTVSNGSSATYTRELTSGSTISLTWHNGQWTQECSFEVTYEDGAVIYQNSGGFSGTQTFTINCAGGNGAAEFCAPIRNLAYELDDQDVVLTWEAPESDVPAWYEIYRETELLDLVEDLTYTDVNVAEGLYNYCVYAAYDGCQSEFVCTEVEVTLCGSIQNLDYTLNDDLLLTLTWEAPEDPTGLVEYQIYMDGEQLAATNELTYAFTVTEGEHDIAVKTVFDGCEKDEHTDVCIVGAVENLHYLGGGGNSVGVGWEPMPGVSEYEVFINGELTATVEEPSYIMFLDAGLTQVVVKPVVDGCYAQSARIEICYIEPVTDLAFAGLDANGMISFTWNPVADVAYYRVYCNDVRFDTEDTSIAFEAVVGENTITVVAISVYGCGSEYIRLTQEVCPAVEDFDYSFNGNVVTVTWNGDADTYLVTGDFMDTSVYVETNSFIYPLEGEGDYHILVRPIYEEDCEALMMDFGFAVTNTAPEIRFTDVREGIMATAWNAVDGAIAYNLYRDNELIAENLTATSYNDTEMALNARHCYAVASVFEKGVSDRSEEVCGNYFTGMDENDGKVNIFPNPTSDKVTIQCAGMSMIEVYTVEGKLVQRIQVEGDIYQLDGLSNGLYTLRILKCDEAIVRRIVKL